MERLNEKMPLGIDVVILNNYAHERCYCNGNSISNETKDDVYNTVITLNIQHNINAVRSDKRLFFSRLTGYSDPYPPQTCLCSFNSHTLMLGR